MKAKFRSLWPASQAWYSSRLTPVSSAICSWVRPSISRSSRMRPAISSSFMSKLVLMGFIVVFLLGFLFEANKKPASKIQ